MNIQQLTKEQALAIAESGIWKSWTDEEVVSLQLFQNLLCVDWSRFHSAIEKVLARPVYTHEFAGREGQKRLQDEYLGKKPKATMDEILSLIPKDKLVVIRHEPCTS